mgnify:CR=1 FL=1
MKKYKILTFVGEAPYSDGDKYIEGIILEDINSEYLDSVFKKLFKHYDDFRLFDSDENSENNGVMNTTYVRFEFKISNGFLV